jgi:hypothetical protein
MLEDLMRAKLRYSNREHDLQKKTEFISENPKIFFYKPSIDGPKIIPAII